MITRLFALAVVVCLSGGRMFPAGDGATGSFRGTVTDSAGRPIEQAEVKLQGRTPGDPLVRFTGAGGRFAFLDVAPDRYSLTVRWSGRTAVLAAPLEIQAGETLETGVRISDNFELLPNPGPEGATAAGATGGDQQLSSREVTGLPLNKRDFGQLLLLSAATRTDTNGSVNFTQQYTVNGQRGVTAVFAMDGVDSSDPELGGATFSNFNVEAIQELESVSGVMPAEFGRGAAGFTNVITKSGTPQVHGSVFEFVRNAAFDARNFFDRRSTANPGRIPPFVRNEFGFTSGGPVVLPKIFDGRNRTFYFGQYQGFRQVLGTTQVLSVPTPDERQGKDTTTFPGDVLLVPVDPSVAAILARYPLPNDPQGPFGERTYATSSKVSTRSDQFSVRIDHRISDKDQVFGRFTLNNVEGPLTNPSQTAIDPSFATEFRDRQRNAGLTYVRTPSPNFISETALGFQRSTPAFPSINGTQPGIRFADNVYEPFNSPAGALNQFYGNLFQVRQNFQWTRGAHVVKAGAEVRANRDTWFGASRPNGLYTFAGGSTYSPIAIASASGSHDIQPGDPLPSALAAFLTATPYTFSTSIAPPGFPRGNRIGEVAYRREAYNFFIQDTWKLSPALTLNYGLRYEVNTQMRAADKRTAGLVFLDSAGRRVPWGSSSGPPKYLINLDPEYELDWSGWGPRVSVAWGLDGRTVFRAGGAIATILPAISQTNLIMGGAPYVVGPILVAAPGSPVQFENSISEMDLPPIYTPAGDVIFGPGQASTTPPHNTEMDVDRFVRDLAALTPDRQVRPITTIGITHEFRNGYIATWSAGLERKLYDMTLDVSYIATAGVKLVRIDFPNGAAGAGPAFAPYARFDETGRYAGEFGPMMLTTNRSHSSFHSLQLSLSRNVFRKGPGFQASYAFSRSLDDTSTVDFAPAQDPRNPGADKGPSTFDIRHSFALSLAQELPADRVPLVRRLGTKFTHGWQVFSVVSMYTGLPFTILSGVQQTGAGATWSDRPDQVGRPVLSTSRTVREDYFGQGAANASFFSVPIGLPGGSGPNQGRFGTLGRNTFCGPAYHNFDIALIKDTALFSGGTREPVTLQFRAEFFNILNVVNFGLPANTVLGSGFGVIHRTAGTSRQIQFSLKLLY